MHSSFINQSTPLTLLDWSNARSSTGTIELGQTTLRMSTGSPVWITFALESLGAISYISFDAEFTSTGHGALGISWEGELLFSIDSRYALGVTSWILPLPFSYGAGTYDLSFRLDPFGTDPASVVISNLHTGMTVEPVPEPSSAALSLLALVVTLLGSVWEKDAEETLDQG